MNVGYEISEKSRWNGEGPDDVFSIAPIVNVDDLRPESRARRLLLLARFVDDHGHERLERQCRQHQQRGYGGENPETVLKLKINYEKMGQYQSPTCIKKAEGYIVLNG